MRAGALVATADWRALGTGMARAERRLPPTPRYTAHCTRSIQRLDAPRRGTAAAARRPDAAAPVLRPATLRCESAIVCCVYVVGGGSAGVETAEGCN
jgi:hypothetical protein